MVINNSITQTFGGFPHHKRSDAEKTKKYFIDNIEAGAALCSYDNSMGLRASRRNKLNNYGLWNDIIDPDEVRRIVNPFGIDYGSLPNNYRNCPLVNPNLMVLFGEERKRFHNPMVTVVNNDAVSEKLNKINGTIDNFLIEQVVSPDMNEEQIQAEIQKLNKWKNYSYKDRREAMASGVLEYLKYKEGLAELFSRGFEDLCFAAESFYISDIVAGEPRAFKGDPVNTVTLGTGNSNRIEDASVIIIDDFVPVGTIIDSYYDELTDLQIKKLEEGSKLIQGTNRGFMGNQLKNVMTESLDSLVEAVGIGEVIVGANKLQQFSFGGYFDEEGNVRRTRVLWKGMRKLGIMEYFDENFMIQKTIVPEQYKPNKELGENIKWIWVSEWYEGTKVGEDIYLKMGPRKVQFRHMDNLSISHPGIVGTIANIGNNVGHSLVDMVKPYQYMYNAIMHSLELDIAKDKGTMHRLDLSMIPEGWTVDKWLYYAEFLGWQIVDPFNEGQKGASTGKLAGTMNQNSSVMESRHLQSIQQKIQLLDFLSRKVDEIMGITPQRKGAIDNRETVGGVERSVTQSTLSTEKWYSIHDNTKMRFYECMLETTKEAWRGKSFKRSFILDDMSMAILDFDSDVFCEAEYGVFITDSSVDMDMMNSLKQLAQPFMQNGGALSLVADLLRTKNPGSFQRKLENYEEQIREANQKAAENQQAIETQKVEFEKYKVDLEAQVKLEIAAMGKEDDSISEEALEKLKLEREKLQKDYELRLKELNETIRSNKENEVINMKKASTPPRKSSV